VLSPATDKITKPSGLLNQMIERLQPQLAHGRPLKHRLVALWGFAKAARGLGERNLLEEQFIKAAHRSGLVRDLGRHGEEDVRHVVSWALLGQNPFEKGPLQ
jgi:hypothetical protein